MDENSEDNKRKTFYITLTCKKLLLISVSKPCIIRIAQPSAPIFLRVEDQYNERKGEELLFYSKI